MKRLVILFLAIIAIFPSAVFAETQVLDLEDTLESESITPLFEDYEETDDQITIYFFRGQGCSHCYELLNFLNSIVDEYGYMFKLRSYEVWYNSDNSEIKDEVVNFFNLDASGVPLLVIGESTFYGFSEESEEKIITAIENEYNSEERYDVFEKMEEKKANKNENDALYILIPIAACVLIYTIVKQVKKNQD